MSENNRYFDLEGNEVSLYGLVKSEPEWAASIIKHLKEKTAEAVRECERIAAKNTTRYGQFKVAKTIRDRFPEYFEDDK